MTERSPAVVAILYAPHLHIGGVETHILSLLRRVDKTRFGYLVIASASPVFTSQAQAAGAAVLPWSLARPWSPRALFRLIRLLKTHQVSLLHIHSPTAALIGRLAAWVARIPAVVTVHLPPWDYVSRSSSLPARFKRWLFTRLDKFLNFRFTGKLIYVSARVFAQALSARLTPAHISTVIPNGIDLDLYQTAASPGDLRQQLSVPADACLLCCVGRLEEQKGIDILLAALAALPADSPPWHLWLVGDGSQRAALQAQAHSLGLDRQVSFLGFREDIPQLLQASDIFVLPSRFEAMPVSILEALAAGLPSIVSDVGENALILAEEQGGLLVPPEDPAALTAALQALLKDPDRRRYLAQAARGRAVAFSDEHMTTRTQNAYSQALGDAAARPLPAVLFCRSNPIAPDPRVEKQARALAAAGYPVTLLGWDRGAALPPYEKRGSLDLFRLAIPSAYGRGPRNLLPLLRWQLALFRWLARHRRNYALIHACDFDTILPALLAARLWRKQVIYDIFDFYADHVRGLPAWLRRFVRAVDYRAIARADAIILPDESRTRQIAGSSPPRTVIIVNSPEDHAGALPAQPDPAPAAQLRLAYVGLLLRERGLLTLLDVLSHHPEWHLDLAGFGGDQTAILARAHGLPNVSWHGRVSYSRAIQLNAQADVLLALYDPAVPNHRYASPNKIFEAMMLAKPVIVAQDSNIDALIEEQVCGIVVPYGSAASLAAALQRLAEDPSLISRLGANARQAYLAYYSWDLMQARLLALYRQLHT
ncbi:MAG: glycosyltransferase [Anaerolineae bacterium]|nr:glycosyltransferase [Anaerolineae bacterium]